ncbi:PREDICTED: prisilkin-39-like [Vollenhovia emeryi]|uniref:prisilkin-39-like n=1 Tax=Vollenhovia emeryi TaxID=411798 RepID=UPI0005F4626E|nr:PREDICTED: prisilkin-39-like [Vollenhovia emeryi]
MLLSAVIICCMAAANAESSLNSYSFTGDGNAYDYSNTVASNGYLGSKDGYQTSGSFYGAGDTNHKLSNHVGGHSLINVGSQGSLGGGDVGNSYNGYSASDQGNEYAGYSSGYESPAGESYSTSTRATATPLRGYISGNNNGEPTFNAYNPSDSVHKDADFGQYAASSSTSSKRVPAYPVYTRPTRVSDNYPEGTADSGVQGYHGGSSGASSYSESEHVYAPYSPGGQASEYSFGKQKNEPLNLKGGGSKYSGVFSIPSETRYTRGNAGHLSYNRDVPSFVSAGSAPGSYFPKVAHGSYSPGKPSKYGYKHLSRYAPNSDVTYMSRERDGYYMPYGKGGGKFIVIKDNSPSYPGRVYADEPIYAASNGGYRSKSGFANGYSVLSNFPGYTGSSSYDDGPTVLRRYRASGPMFLQRPIYA